MMIMIGSIIVAVNGNNDESIKKMLNSCYTPIPGYNINTAKVITSDIEVDFVTICYK